MTIGRATSHRAPRGKEILAALLTGVLSPTWGAASTIDDALLIPAQAAEGDLGAGEVRAYRVACRQGDYVQITVEQRTGDAAVTVWGPGGSKIAEIDRHAASGGPETALFVAAADGDHRLLVRAADKKQGTSYRVRLDEQRPARPEDRARFEAWRVWEDADRLRAQGSKESLTASAGAYERAVGALEALGQRDDAATALAQAGELAYSRGETARAVAIFERILALTPADRPDRNRGAAYLGLGAGQPERAIEWYEQALQVFRAVGDRGGEASALNGLALARDRQLSDSASTIRAFEEVLEISRSIGDERLQRLTLHAIGVMYRRRDDRQKALDYLTQALSLKRVGGDLREVAVTLNEIGMAYAQWGDHARALDFYEEALAAVRGVGNLRLAALIDSNMGRAHLAEGRLDEALRRLAAGLEASRQAADKDIEAWARADLGQVEARRGNLLPAAEHLEAALTLFRQSAVKYWPLWALLPLGDVYLRQGDGTKAEATWREARQLAQDLGSPDFEAAALDGLARVALKSGDPAAGLERAAKAVERVESQRTSIARADLRTAYFASVRDYYQTNIAALMALHARNPGAGHAAEALQVSERARARRMLEAAASSSVDIHVDADPRLLERERTLRQEMAVLAARSTELLRGRGRPGQRESVDRKLREVAAEGEDVLAQLRRQSPRYAALSEPRVLSAAAIQREVLEPDTVLLEYALGADRSYLWAVSTTDVGVRELAPAARIEELARALYEAVAVRGLDTASDPIARERRAAEGERRARSLATELARAILPVDIGERVRRFVIVADGALQAVPFAALPWGSGPGGVVRRPLAERFEVVFAPSASWVAAVRRSREHEAVPARTIAVLADPVLDRDDRRLRAVRRRVPAVRGPGATRLAPLLYSAREARAAAAAARVGGRDALLILGFDANRQRALSANLADYQIVHFATHSLLNNEHPELSGIVLSGIDKDGHTQDGFLRLQDVYGMKLPAEVVVLSACQTAVGKAMPGEGLLGLARGFMYAGARRVVASLWPIDDAATFELMQAFYGGLFRDHLAPAEALRRAQLVLASRPRWRAPYYWAGFVIQGDWRAARSRKRESP